MVKICSETYPKQGEEKYKEYIEIFPFPLSCFQKYSIEAIVEGHHTLVCVPTGSGKTLPGIFAIDYFTKLGKKVIYTSPIKALSNQKYHEFTEKFPGVSVGLITGDIKLNPEAQVLIMTAEILENTLYMKKQKSSDASLLLFDLNFDTELGCVIHDEVHMINDAGRGHTWENMIMMMPLHVQMVMLSATLDTPEKFAMWVENRHAESDIKKQVYLCTSNHRIVPLTHYCFITTNQGIYKAIKKDEVLEKEIKKTVDKLHVIQSATGEFNDTTYHQVKKMLDLFQQKQVWVKRQHVLNEVCKYMVENNMLPAACFIMSRKQIEIAAKEVTVVLLEDDSKVPYTVRRECEQLLRQKLPNYQEYLELPEYNNLVSLLEKGIAIHHSGCMPILREIVEILFERGYIKLLFCTETFSVGLNMPIKTVLFTDLTKYDGTNNRMFYSHEYMQTAGRAGRRGIDTVGHVIHLNNLFRNVNLPDYRIMMNGKPQTLVSKFKTSYNLMLNLIETGDDALLQFCQKSMIQDDITGELNETYKKIVKLEEEAQKMDCQLEMMKCPREIVEKYIHAQEELKISGNKKRKELQREILAIEDNYKSIHGDRAYMKKLLDKLKEIEKEKQNYEITCGYLKNNVYVLVNFLEKEGYLTKDEDGRLKMTELGHIGSHLREVHCLIFARLIKEGKLNELTPLQLIKLFSCFTNINVDDSVKTVRPYSDVKILLEQIEKDMLYYEDFETHNQINTGVDYTIHYDILNAVENWVICNSAQECKTMLQHLEIEKGIFLGEFIKAILKIHNVSNEMEKIVESIGNMELLQKLKQIPEMILKFVATTQSLYV
jgi:superfamily II RNA helicase